MEKPLRGIKVIDFTRLFAGPFCTMHLGDLGADVVKVEEPNEGDPIRAQGPPFHMESGMSFYAANRNKRSLVLDMRKKEGKVIAKRLALKADVLVENFRPGVMDRLGLGYDDLAGENPKLVYAALSGFGATGPYKDKGAFDLTIQAEGGYMSITGERKGTPIKLGTSAFDLVCGIFAKSAILVSLFQLKNTGKGQKIETSLFEAEISFLVNAATEYLITGNIPGRWGSEHPQVVPYKAFKTADGWLVIGAGVQRLFESFMKVIQREDLIQDPRFTNLGARVENRDELYALLDAEVAKYPTGELLGKLSGAGVACSPVNNVAEVFKHPQALHRGMLKQLNHPRYGQIPTVGPAVKYSGFDIGAGWAAPPLLGEHSTEVLKDWLALGDPELDALVKGGVISQPR